MDKPSKMVYYKLVMVIIDITSKAKVIIKGKIKP